MANAAPIDPSDYAFV